MKILCIDDAPDILGVLGLSLKLKWPDAEVFTAGDGRSGMDVFKEKSPDLVIVDLGMPGMDGYEVIRQIRLISDVPIVILTVRDEDRDIAKGLEAGADDYITKPFSHTALVARLQAALRRAHYGNGSDPDKIEIGDVRIETSAQQVFVKGKPVACTAIEFSLLHHLARDAGKVRTFEALLRETWGDGSVDDRHMLTVHVNQLRAKLGDDTRTPTLILTERGVGYSMVRKNTNESEVDSSSD